MNHDEALLRLSRHAGIEPVYWDIRGQRHETSPDTARAMLHAQGIPAASAADVALSLDAIEESPWREMLPPVAAGREGQAVSLAVHVPLDAAGTRVLWRIDLEDGAVRSGGFDLQAVVPMGVREIDGRPIGRWQVHVPPLPCGYHRFVVPNAGERISTTLIVAPDLCYVPPGFLRREKGWGIAAQLYALRGERDLGIGDFGDLASLVEWAAARGAAAVGINPLHALFQQAPSHASPYSPNSRRFLNALYLDISAIPDLGETPAAQVMLGAAGSAGRNPALVPAGRVDYEAAAAVKLPILAALYENFRAYHQGKSGDPRGDAFVAFQARGGRALERFALHQSLCEVFANQDWSAWPPGYRDPGSEETARFAQDRVDRLAFHEYLQWQCDLQISAISRKARERGMEIGIYGDLATGSSPDGADVWDAQDLYALGARIGAPPDPFNEAGQEWGVVPMAPSRMAKSGYADVIALLRANMCHFGALRIDHVMGMQRQFWVPCGHPPSAGAYVRYPFDDLLAILTLESRRNECLLIGEDLGTVPEGFRPRMADAAVLSYRVLYFESERGRFKVPESYPPLSAACVSTHDLPTLKGYWEETDLADRLRAGVLQSEEELAGARAVRRAEKRALIEALMEAGLAPAGTTVGEGDACRLTFALGAAIHRFLARSPALLFMAQLDDLTGEAAQANMPGTTDSYPNWRRRMSVPLRQLADAPFAREILAATVAERPEPSR